MIKKQINFKVNIQIEIQKYIQAMLNKIYGEGARVTDSKAQLPPVGIMKAPELRLSDSA